MVRAGRRALFFIVLAGAILLHRTPVRAAEKTGSEPIEVLIMAGDPDEAEAQKKFKKVVRHLSWITPPLTLPDGYPKLVKSADYKGLKPGFFITIAGFCPKSLSQQALAVLRKAESGAYVRTVDVAAGTQACPTRLLKDYLQDGYQQAAGSEGTSQGLVAVYRKDSYGVSKDVEVLLLGEKGLVTASWTDATELTPAPSNGPESEFMERTVQPSGGDYEVRVREGYINPATNCSVSKTHSYRVGIVKGELAVKSSSVKDDKSACGE